MEYDHIKIEGLLSNPSIICNKYKNNVIIYNAEDFINVQTEHGTFDNYIWEFVNNKTIVNAWNEMHQMPKKRLRYLKKLTTIYISADLKRKNNWKESFAAKRVMLL